MTSALVLTTEGEVEREVFWAVVGVEGVVVCRGEDKLSFLERGENVMIKIIKTNSLP